MGIFGLIFAAVSLGLNAYNAYASSSAQEQALEIQKQQLAAANIRTEAEKRIAEMQFNNVTAQSFGNAGGSRSDTAPVTGPGSVTPGRSQNWLLIAAIVAFSAIAFKALA